MGPIGDISFCGATPHKRSSVLLDTWVVCDPHCLSITLLLALLRAHLPRVLQIVSFCETTRNLIILSRSVVGADLTKELRAQLRSLTMEL
jgi:hypothetical protein